MLERLLPPWALLLAGVLLVAVLGAGWASVVAVVLIAGHFVLKHYGHEGLFGGKSGGKYRDD